MNVEIPPAFLFLAGAALLPLLPRKAQPAAFLLFPFAALLAVFAIPSGTALTATFYKYELIYLKVDALSRAFGIIFALIAFVGGIYSWHLKETGQRVASLLYAGGALGVTFAGDLFTLLLYWELMAVASTYLVWAHRTREAETAGMRYLLVHLAGGSVLFAGIVLHFQATGDLSIRAFNPGESSAAWLILLGVAINAAIPPLHAWLADSYPKATVTGAVFLSAFTTKSAVYVLARMFPGWDLLLYFGTAMTLYGVTYAVLANDIRRILAYHIISQVGYMVAGVGVGTALAINGTTAHAFSHILYKALLFMGAGAVLHTTGKSKLTDLGGLAKAMPWTLAFYTVGALSISGAPLFNGFISKSIIVMAAGEEHHYACKFLLILAGVGTFLSIALKLLYFTWFGPDRGLKPAPVPRNMVLGMGILAFLCFWHGVQPGMLYRLLPHEMDYNPFTVAHLVEAIQILTFTFVAFWLMRAKFEGKAVIALDTDWLYRKPAPLARMLFIRGVNRLFDGTQERLDGCVSRIAQLAANPVALFKAGRGEGGRFNPDEHRPSLGASVALTLLVVVALAFWVMF